LAERRRERPCIRVVLNWVLAPAERSAPNSLELVSKPIAGDRERGAPLRAAGPSLVTSAFRHEDEVGLFAGRTRA